MESVHQDLQQQALELAVRGYMPNPAAAAAVVMFLPSSISNLHE
jgi:hypothetical protein